MGCKSRPITDELELLWLLLCILWLRYNCAWCSKVRLRHWSAIRQRRFQSSTRNNRAKVIIVHSGYTVARVLSRLHIKQTTHSCVGIQWTLRTSLCMYLTYSSHPPPSYHHPAIHSWTHVLMHFYCNKIYNIILCVGYTVHVYVYKSNIDRRYTMHTCSRAIILL